MGRIISMVTDFLGICIKHSHAWAVFISIQGLSSGLLVQRLSRALPLPNDSSASMRSVTTLLLLTTDTSPNDKAYFWSFAVGRATIQAYVACSGLPVVFILFFTYIVYISKRRDYNKTCRRMKRGRISSHYPQQAYLRVHALRNRRR